MLMKYIIFFIALNYIVSSESEKDKNFGSFNLTLVDIKPCKGPKQKDCATTSVTITGHSVLKYTLDLPNNAAPNKGKVTCLKSGMEVMRFQVKKPCDHLFFKPLFHSLMNITKDCVILKGHYEFNADVQKVAQNYWAGAFLFGNWTFKSVFYSDDCNFYCSVIDAILFENKD